MAGRRIGRRGHTSAYRESILMFAGHAHHARRQGRPRRRSGAGQGQGQERRAAPRRGSTRSKERFHRAMSAWRLDRPLRVSEVVHHVNGDLRDHRPDDLAVISGQPGQFPPHRDPWREQAGVQQLSALQEALQARGEYAPWPSRRAAVEWTLDATPMAPAPEPVGAAPRCAGRRALRRSEPPRRSDPRSGRPGRGRGCRAGSPGGR